MKLLQYWLILLIGASGLFADEQVRVTIQVIQYDHIAITQWLNKDALNGNQLHAKALDEVMSGRAQLIDTCVAIMSGSDPVAAVSGCEIIYPTEYEYDKWDRLNQKDVSEEVLSEDFELPPIWWWMRHSPLYYTFETRNTGTALEAKIEGVRSDKVITLNFAYESVQYNGHKIYIPYEDIFGEASFGMPKFSKNAINQKLDLKSGAYQMVALFTPQSDTEEYKTQRRLVFVRADLLKSGQAD